ncbi:MAG: protein-L-isoaspartate O-methyltransferase family protein [Terriglobales bacterium]
MGDCQRDAFAQRLAPPGRVRQAFRAVAREAYVPGAPPERVCADTPLPLGPPGINNGQPSLHAACISALDPQPGERALHVGAGTGYYTAILAELVAEVDAYEVEPELARQARANLAGYPRVRVRQRSGAVGPLPRADLIYVNCGATAPLDVWLEALRPGGRLLFPLTGSAGAGAMLLVGAGAGSTLPARWVAPVVFIDCVGARQKAEAQALDRAFARGGRERVRLLGRGLPAAGEAWVAGRGWWLG